MMENPEESELFMQIANLVGEGEIEARKVLGDAGYEEMMAVSRKSNELGLKKDEAQIHYLEMNTVLLSATAFTLITACILGIAWTIYAWV